MAAAAGLERRTFLRRFANATGMTPIEYCRTVRIARGRELLECGNTPQKEIAQSLGYKDVASFARVFRKVTGLTPGAHRKKFGVNAMSSGDFAQKDALSPGCRSPRQPLSLAKRMSATGAKARQFRYRQRCRQYRDRPAAKKSLELTMAIAITSIVVIATDKKNGLLRVRH